jgi:hypothetical protein
MIPVMIFAKHLFVDLREINTHTTMHATKWKFTFGWWRIGVDLLLLLAGELWLAPSLPYSSLFSSWCLPFSSWSTPSACPSPPDQG